MEQLDVGLVRFLKDEPYILLLFVIKRRMFASLIDQFKGDNMM